MRSFGFLFLFFYKTSRCCFYIKVAITLSIIYSDEAYPTQRTRNAKRRADVQSGVSSGVVPSMKATNPAVVSSGSVNPVVHPGISSGDVNSVKSKKDHLREEGPQTMTRRLETVKVLRPLGLLLLDTQERLTELVQLYDPAAGMFYVLLLSLFSCICSIAREAALSSQVHFLEQRVQMLEEETETQKKLNAQLED
ncbi:hypothetical protein Rs2_12687 [Raphanus sativus]|nr:hypothetical protein Rs2_12687 [Raphanus sativus]